MEIDLLWEQRLEGKVISLTPNVVLPNKMRVVLCVVVEGWEEGFGVELNMLNYCFAKDRLI